METIHCPLITNYTKVVSFEQFPVVSLKCNWATVSPIRVTSLKMPVAEFSVVYLVGQSRQSDTWEKRTGHFIVEFSLAGLQRSSFLRDKARRMIADVEQCLKTNMKSFFEENFPATFRHIIIKPLVNIKIYTLSHVSCEQSYLNIFHIIYKSLGLFTS